MANAVKFEDHKFEPPATKMIYELVIKPNKRSDTDEDVMAQTQFKMGQVLDMYEAELRKFK